MENINTAYTPSCLTGWHYETVPPQERLSPPSCMHVFKMQIIRPLLVPVTVYDHSALGRGVGIRAGRSRMDWTDPADGCAIRQYI